MGFFGKILNKLGFGDAAAQTPGAATSATSPAATPGSPETVATTNTGAGAGAGGGTTPAGQASPVQVVDVVAQLEQRAAANPQKLNWRTSIVDLLKLLDIDSSLTARKELATELGCPADLMGDSAKMNMWLHKTVLNRIAANGGNIPKELLD